MTCPSEPKTVAWPDSIVEVAVAVKCKCGTVMTETGGRLEDGQEDVGMILIGLMALIQPQLVVMTCESCSEGGKAKEDLVT